MKHIFESFSLSRDEEMMLEEAFGNLCNYAAWELYRRNTRNNHTDEIEDLIQELKFAIVVAGCYYKRQTYIEDCLNTCKNVKDKFTKKMVKELQYLWDNRTRHGANKQKFGLPQEQMLDEIVLDFIPVNKRPIKSKTKLVIDGKFTTYAKSILWNTQKAIGKRITKERSIRQGMASLSQFSYLGAKVDKLSNLY